MKKYLSTLSPLAEKFRREDLLFTEGEPFNGLFLINKGVVRISQTNREGQDFVFWMAGAGELIGLSSYFNAKSYIYTAQVASASCEVQRISAKDLEDVINNSLDAKKHLMKLLCQRIEFTENRTRQFIGRNGDDRLAETLLFLAKNRSFSSSKGQKLVSIPYTFKDLSDITGIRQTYLTKLMAKLRRDALCLPKSDGFIIDIPRMSAIVTKPLLRKDSRGLVG
jgi:CRP-like cAMP-binding protein